MSIFGTSCPPPFYHNSRELKVLARLKTRIEPFCGTTSEWTRMLAEFDGEEAQILLEHMREQKSDVYRKFPGLTFFPPKPSASGGMPAFDLRAIAKEIRRSSLLTGERRRFKRIRRLMREAKEKLPSGLPPEIARRKLIELQEMKLFEAYSRQYGLERRGMKFRRFKRLTHEAIKRTRGFLRDLLETYVPDTDRAQLDFAACVDSARDFPTLIALASKLSGKGVISRRIGHEARIMAVLSQLEFEYLIGPYNPDRVDTIMQDLIFLFEEKVFDRDQSLRLMVVAELDPRNAYRVKRDASGKPDLVIYPDTATEAPQASTATRLVLPLDVRVIRHGGRLIPVYFDDRRKEMIWVKLLRKIMRHPEHITDHSGLICVLFGNGQDEEVLADKLRDEIATNPGQVTAHDSNAARAGAVDQRNLHSSVDRRGEKYELMWGGISHELQILDIATYIDSRFCRNRLAHSFYKFLTLADTAFPFIWPKELYGKDWLEAKFRDVLWEFLAKQQWTGPAIPIKPDVPCLPP